MKLISLNAWHGQQPDELRSFISSHLETTDVFCFQEASGPSVKAVFDQLFDGSSFSAHSVTKTAMDNTHYALRTFVKKPLEIKATKILLDDKDPEVGQALATTITVGTTQNLTVVNVHGVPFPGHKLDTKGRLRQTERIITQLSGTAAVICGDFNLLPESSSVRNFASAGYQDLISLFSIPATRNSLAWERFPGNEQAFADYAFVSPALTVAAFTVPSVDASDHLPLIIELE